MEKKVDYISKKKQYVDTKDLEDSKKEFKLGQYKVTAYYLNECTLEEALNNIYRNKYLF